MEVGSVVAMGSSLAIGIVVWLMIWWWKSVKYLQTMKGLPPGSMGWPLLGETLQLVYNHDQYICSQRRRYGDIFTTNLLGAPTIICLDPDVNRFVLQNDGQLFAPSYPKSVNDVAGRYHILAVFGSLHKKYRGVAHSLSGNAMLKELLEDMETFFISNLDSWEGRIVNVRKEAISMSLGILMKESFGHSPQEGITGLSQDLQDLFEGFFTFPVKVPGTGYWKGIKARQRVVQKLTRVIEEKRQQPQKLQDDLLGKILFAEEHQMDPPLTNEQIIDMLISVLLAGFDTTANAMALSLHFLNNHPQVLIELRKEHALIRKTKCGSTDKLTWLDYKSMNFTQNVISETLRLANISPGAYRKTLQNVDCNGYTFPEGWNIITYYRATHLDPAFFPNPKQLNPWRWQEKDSKSQYFTPFGGGKRLCPGMELARLEISVFLHHLVTRYSWEPVEKDRPLIFPRVRMMKGYPVVVRKLRKPDYE
ncbi:hypothetical protein O6H91_02G082300 [Diphasiastrum complanatum]|uniref:Uncharacterized protein n=1 Tax=Diphasiastrum complanatum TaxID=34168 RepID=A0ACC2EHR8_DIPCM|nr:hypothetical protein O6H91_02G082300 [Diphasiastrum complanatum]